MGRPPTIVSLNPEGVAADVLVAGERLLAVNCKRRGHTSVIVRARDGQMLKSAVGAADRKCRAGVGRRTSTFNMPQHV